MRCYEHNICPDFHRALRKGGGNFCDILGGSKPFPYDMLHVSHTMLLTYSLTYLLHGAESFLRS